MKKGNCWECGKPLIQIWHEWYGSEKYPKVSDSSPCGIIEAVDFKDGKVHYCTGQTGYNGNGVFCSRKCGYEWAISVINKAILADIILFFGK